MAAVLLVLSGLFGALAAGPVSAPAPGPYHAFCRTLWLFAVPCGVVGRTLEKQVDAMSPAVGCPECRYTLVSATNATIRANHSSTDGRLVEDVSFSLCPTSLTAGCRVAGESTSLSFTSLLDDGLNYCNLYNLLAGSGLRSAPGFMEITNDWACLGVGLATCDG